MYLSSHKLDTSPRPLAGSLCSENPRERTRTRHGLPYRRIVVSLETAETLSTEHGDAENLLSSWFGEV